YSYAHPRQLPSFPTRRSSDLAALRLMRDQGSGVIVNNASVIGWRAQRGQSHYAAAKAGVMALTRCAALEAAEFGVRINAVSPSRSEEHTSELQSRENLVCRLL